MLPFYNLTKLRTEFVEKPAHAGNINLEAVKSKKLVIILIYLNIVKKRN